MQFLSTVHGNIDSKVSLFCLSYDKPHAYLDFREIFLMFTSDDCRFTVTKHTMKLMTALASVLLVTFFAQGQ